MSKYFKAYKFLKDKAGTITGVAPDLKKTVKETKSDEYIKRIDKLDSAQKKLTEGKKMMKEAQKERKNLVDTGRAFQFKGLKSYHAMNPAGDKTRYAKSMKVPGPQKKFLKGKEETVYGLAGVGDLYVSAVGGRNSKMGEFLGKGLTFKSAKKKFMLNDTIEGAELAFEIGKQILKKVNIL